MLKPTNMPLVPRMLNRIYDRVKNEIGNSKVKAYLLQRAIAAKEAERLKYVILLF